MSGKIPDTLMTDQRLNNQYPSSSQYVTLYIGIYTHTWPHTHWSYSFMNKEYEHTVKNN